jgi:hypothetical protein
MSRAGGSSATIKSNENTGIEDADVVGRWREGILVLPIVLAPIGLAVIVMAIGLATQAWQIVHGASIELPTPASIRLYGLLSYAVGSWIAVALAWLLSKRLQPALSRASRARLMVFR